MAHVIIIRDEFVFQEDGARAASPQKLMKQKYPVYSKQRTATKSKHLKPLDRHAWVTVFERYKIRTTVNG